MKHASVRIAGYDVPLIGLSESETTSQCDGCSKEFHIQELTWVIRHKTVLLCTKCKEIKWTMNS